MDDQRWLVQENGHVFPAMNVSGSAQVHLGDRYYADRNPEIQAADRLSASLYYPEIIRRYESLAEPESGTCKWVLRSVDTQVSLNGAGTTRGFITNKGFIPRWDCFVSWLTNDEPIYWISGNPGSGKSTLLKYLVDHLEDSSCLQDCATIVISFWFWDAGTDLQKTAVGCYRSLLWQLIRIPSIAEYVLAAVLPLVSEHPTWNRSRLAQCLRNALEAVQNAGLSLMLFLDGLDESPTDGEDVLEEVRDLADFLPGLKVCVSSRPEQRFVDSLSTCPKLRLQDLNERDINSVIDQKLFANARVAKALKDKGPLRASLRESLQSKAQGVFLWVHLTIQSLVRGFRNYDPPHILLNRLEALPNDLYSLYEAMLTRDQEDRSACYEESTALYLRLILQEELPLIDFCLAIRNDIRHSFLSPPFDWNPETVPSRLACDDVSVWVNVRSGGLLQVTDTMSISWHTSDTVLGNYLNQHDQRHVTFIHRTVRSFLTDTARGASLLSSWVHEQRMMDEILFESTLISDYILTQLGEMCATHIAPPFMMYHDPVPSKDSLRMLENVLNEQKRRGVGNGVIDNSTFLGLKGYENIPFGPDDTVDICALCCLAGWTEHATHFLRTSHTRMHVMYYTYLLLLVILGIDIRDGMRIGESNCEELFDCLIEMGANPNLHFRDPQNTFAESTSFLLETVLQLREKRRSYWPRWLTDKIIVFAQENKFSS